MAASSMKDIKRRIKSVQSTMQITKAMELVASSKLRRAKEKAEETRPFFDTLYAVMSEIAEGTKGFTSRFTTPREVKSVGYIVVGGERGLAGGYNSNVFKLSDAHMKGKDAKVIAIGKKSCEYYRKSSHPVVLEYSGVGEHIDVPESYAIAQAILKLYDQGEFDELYISYTNFINTLTQEPAIIKVLPVNLEPSGQPAGPGVLTIYEPSPEEVFDAIVPEYVAGILHGAVVESFASEQAARRTAMETASDNAQELVNDLDLKYNRARQAAITQEITEIVAGAGAL